MKLRFHGFLIKGGKHFKFTMLATRFDDLAKEESISFQGKLRELHLASTKEYFAGCLITIGKDSRYAGYNMAHKKLRHGELPGETFSGYNFFAISRKSSRGLYSTVKEGMGVGTFFEFFEAQAKASHRALKREAVKDSKFSRDDPRRAELEEEFHCKCQRLYTRQELEAILTRCRAINAVRVQLATIESQKDSHMPLMDKVRTESITYQIDSGKATGPAAMAKEVGRFYLRMKEAAGFEGFSVLATNHNNERKTYKAINTPEDFGVFDVSELQQKGKLDVGDITRSEILGMMIAEIKSKPEYFE